MWESISPGRRVTSPRSVTGTSCGGVPPGCTATTVPASTSTSGRSIRDALSPSNRRAPRMACMLGRLSRMQPRHLEGIEWRPRREVDLGQWPYAVPAVRQLIDEGGLDIGPGVTILVGENGSGKSTLIEAFATVYPRRGAESSSPIPVTGPSGSMEDSPLHWHLKARTHGLAAPGGFFLRA